MVVLTPQLNIRKNVAFAMGAFVGNLALVLVSYRLAIAHGGLQAMGLWSILMSWVQVLRLADAGMGAGTARFVAARDLREEAEAIRRTIDTGLLANLLVFSVLGLGGFLLMQAQIDWLLPSDAAPGLRAKALEVLPIALLGFVLMNLSAVLLGALQGLHLGYLTSQLGLLGSLVQLVVVATLVPSLGLPGLAWGLVAQHGLTAAVCWALVLRRTGWGSSLPVHASGAALKEILGYSVKWQVLNGANGLLEPLSKIFVGRLGGIEAQGLFELAYKAVSLPRNAVVAGAHATLPAITNLLATDRPGARALYRSMLRKVAGGALAVLALAALGTPLLSVFWLGYLSVPFTASAAVLALGFWFSALAAPAYILGLASGRMGWNILGALLALTVMTLAAVPLGGALGALGVGAALSLALAVSSLFIKTVNERTIL